MDTLLKVIKSIDKNSCPYKINFHCHTKFSDGTLNPVDLYKQACDNNITNIAITDHHTIKGYKLLRSSLDLLCNEPYRPNLWSGVEISGLLDGSLVHIIALGFDINNLDMQKYLQGNSVKGINLKAESIVSAIHNANGLCILAHPARYKLHFNHLILEAAKIGFDGIEVWYDYERSSIWKATPFICDKIYSLTHKLGMLTTCGTDTHGTSILCR